MAQKVEVDVRSEPIRQTIARWTEEMGLDFSRMVVTGKTIAVEISHALKLTEELMETLRRFFVEIAKTHGLKIVAKGRSAEERAMTCAFEYR